ncbi:hypothetical protein BYT27DRAFT_7261627 [Phlegmacium glaucopus]|nr:hypothetical protein BYT27DRAFT_7261627 [Phlegmacium glaucopus]
MREISGEEENIHPTGLSDPDLRYRVNLMTYPIISRPVTKVHVIVFSDVVNRSTEAQTKLLDKVETGNHIYPQIVDIVYFSDSISNFKHY